MSAVMPELGSKISLISKADIRYEGRLFTVDPIECTIALASVRSYGTEDRETQYPIHPQNQVYEYILFRGSDIKDIRVINNVPVPNDPAIMQMHLPPTAQQQFAPNGQFPGNMAHMSAPMPGQPFNNIYSSMSSSFAAGAGQNLAPGAPGSLNKSKQSSELNIAIPEPSSTTQLLDQDSLQEMIGSRSTTPTSRKSPAHDVGPKPNQSRNEQMGNNSQRDNSRRSNRNKSQQRERKDSAKNDQVEHKTPQRNQQFHGNNQRNWNNNRGNNNNQMRGNRPRGRGMNQQGFTQSLQNNKGRAKTKFRNDYDFEEANKKFDELCLKSDNVKVGDEANAVQTNGEVDKKDDSGNETGAGEHEVEEEYVGVGYDKTKSFFDNISCEAATDRTKGKAHKDWHQERKINSETFGPSARRGGFFNYRGRGGFYNRNAMNSGGYRGGNANYNRGGSYRQYNRNYNSNSTGIPQQTNKPEQAEAPAEAAAAN